MQFCYNSKGCFKKVVYKKYTYKQGRRYGPYLYENTRVGEKIITNYLGKDDSPSGFRFSNGFSNQSNNFWAISLVSILILATFYSILVVNGFISTGRVTADVETLVYQPGDNLAGTVKFNIREGELIPQDARVTIRNGNQVEELYLSDVSIRPALLSGDFYAEKSTLSGSGDGFGVMGKKITKPEVDFQILITHSEEVVEEDVSISDNTDNISIDTGIEMGGGGSEPETEEGTTTETGSEVTPQPENQAENEEQTPPSEQETTETTPTTTETGSESSGTEPVTGTDEQVSGDLSTETSSPTSSTSESSESSSSDSSDSGSSEGSSSDSGSDSGGGDSGGDSAGESSGDSGGITGNAIIEDAYTIDGSISKDETFDYNLEEGQTVELIKGSVKVDGKEIEDNNVKLTIKDGKVIVSTNYQIVEEGFGVKYLGDYAMTLKLDLAVAGLKVESDEVYVDMSYNGVHITSGKSEIRVYGNESFEENVVVSIRKDIPTIRVNKGGSQKIDLTKYFANANSYSFEAANISSRIEGDSLILTPDKDFRGARKGKVIAYLNGDKVESNYFDIIVSSLKVKTNRSEIKVGEPVKWTKEIELTSASDVTIEVPKQATNIEVQSLNEGVSGITGFVVIEIDLDKEPRIVTFFKKVFRAMTGRVIDENGNGIIDGDEDVKDVQLDGEAGKYVIEYETPAPSATEKDIENGKRVIVSAPDELGYTDVLSFADIPEVYDVGEESKIKIYWMEEEKLVSFDAYDLDDDGKIDYVEWVVPHLSSQTFDIILSGEGPSMQFGEGTSENGTTVTTLNVELQTGDDRGHYAFVDLDGSVVGYWRGEGNADNDVGVSPGSEENGASYASGKFGNAFSFDGSDDYVSASLSSYPLANSARSLSVWAKSSAATDPGEFGMLSYGSGDSNVAFGLIMRGDGDISCTSWSNDLDSDQAINDDGWHHVVCTFDGVNRRLYVDGVLVTNDTTSMNTAEGELRIGSWFSESYFPGSLDEVILFNRSLSASEVASLYNADSNPYSNAFTGLSNETHYFRGYAVNELGYASETEERTINSGSVTESDCADSIDNDEDGNTDCADSDCEGLTGPNEETCEPSGESTCNDGWDNDGDGNTDCDDSDCSENEVCDPCYEVSCDDGASCESGTCKEDTCDDAMDNDGATDCDDSDCFGNDPSCLTETNCGDSNDNDGDGYTDCLDDDCSEDPACDSCYEVNCNNGYCDAGSCICDGGWGGDNCDVEDLCYEVSCDDGASCESGTCKEDTCDDAMDNDGDSSTDCDDDDCCIDEGCLWRYNCGGTESSCDDLEDNDGDSSTDCDDSDCSEDPACAPATESDCADSIDNDEDGNTDCADSDCEGLTGPNEETCEPSGESTCNDGWDNDGDSSTDCDDSDCSENEVCDPCYEVSCDEGASCESGTCKEDNCNDAMDNDNDANTDCDDSDCSENEVCDPCYEVSCDEGASCESGTCKEDNCNDAMDNDNDANTDCDDSDCSENEVCSDTTPPTGEQSGPSDGGSSSSSSNNFTGIFSDAGGLANATLYVYNAVNELVNQTTVALDGALEATVGVVVSLADGVYTWFYDVFDMAGNLFTTGNWTLTVDAASLAIEFVTPPTPNDLDVVNVSSFNVSMSSSGGEHYAFLNFDNSLVGWWRGEDNANDNSSNANDGTWNSNEGYTQGKFGQAFNFHGSDDYFNYVQMTDTSFPMGNSSRTFAAWVYPTNHDRDNTIFSYGTSACTAKLFSVQLTGEGDLHFWGGCADHHSGLSVPLNEWSFVAITYNGSRMTYYVNDQTATWDVALNTISNGEMYLANWHGVALQWSYNGLLDDVVIFNRSLSASEMLSLYNATANQYTNNFTGLANGAHTIKGYAVDSAGNKNQTETRTVIVSVSAPDTTAPLINFTGQTPANGQTVTNSYFNVSLNSSDNSREHYSFANFDNSLVGWWRAENSPNDTLGVNNGTLQGGATYNSSGKFGSAFSFDGSDDRVNTTLIYSYPTLTVQTWIYPKSYGNTQWIAGDWEGGGSGSSFGLDYDESSTHRIRFTTKIGGSEYNLKSNSTLALNTWHQVVGVFNGTIMELYLNGVLDNSSSNISGNLSAATNTFKIGGMCAACGTKYFNGSVDDVLIFNRSLSASEIASLYNATANQYTNNFTGLVNGAHTIKGYAVDSAGNANNTELRTITVNTVVADTTSPYFTTIPANASLEYGTALGVDFEATDAVGFGSYYLGNWTSTFQINSTGYLSNISALSAGTYVINVSINDTSGNANMTWYQVVVSDSIAPSITVYSPTATNYSNSSILVNFTASDASGISNFWFNNGTTNVTGNLTTVVIGEGSHTFTFYANDTNGNENSTSVAFYVDLTAPSITVYSPTDTTYTNANVTINFTATDDVAVGSYWYNNGSANVSYTVPVNVTLSDGSYEFVFYANDTVGNENSTSVTFTVDTPLTDLTIDSVSTSPASPSDVDNISIIVNVTSDVDGGGVTCDLTGDLGTFVANASAGSNKNATFNLGTVSFGNYYYNVSCSDLSGTNESLNNLISVVNAPNIYPSNITFSASNPLRGQSIIITVNVKSDYAEAQNVLVKFYDDGVNVENKTISSVGADSEAEAFISYAFSTDGTHIVTAETSISSVSETDYSDNSFTKGIIIGDVSYGGIASSIFVTPNPVNYSQTFSVNGTALYDFSPYWPVAGGAVVLTYEGDGNNPERSYTTTTDSQGRYSFTGISANNSVGSYTLSIAVSDGSVAGTNSTLLEIVVGSSNLPDLSITSTEITLNDSIPIVNESVRITAKVRNYGGVNSSATVHFYDGAVLIGETNVSNVPSGSYNNTYIDYVFESAGTHSVKVALDPRLEIEESSESNNNATKSVKIYQNASDLNPYRITTSKSAPSVDENVTLTGYVRNLEGLSASNVYVEFYANDVLIAQKNISSISGASGTGTTSINYSFASAGSYNIKLVVNPAQTITESSYSNNNYTSTGLVVVYDSYTFDLAVSDISSTRTLYADNTVNFTAAVKNIDAGNITDSINVDFYLNGTLIGNGSINGLSGGQTKNASLLYNLTKEHLGSINVTVAVNQNESVTETSYTNNDRNELLNVYMPNLRVLSADITFSPENATIGESVNISVVVTNLVNASAKNIEVIINTSGGFSNSTLVNISALSSASTLMTWDSASPQGSAVVSVYVNQNYSSYESDSSNNYATRSLGVLGMPPQITLTNAPNENEVVLDSFGVNVSTVNATSIVYSLYYANGTEVSSVTYDSDTTDYTFDLSELEDGEYLYEVNATIFGAQNSTGVRSVTAVSSCLEQCTEEEGCVISSDCALSNDLCSEDICTFDNFTIGAKIYTLYDSDGNGKNLTLNLTSNATGSSIMFLPGNSIIFSGRAGTDLSSGSQGGNAGIINITVYDLFNTTRAMLIGTGGYTTLSGSAGGNGGQVQLNYHGLIRKFTDSSFGLDSNTPQLTVGSSVDVIDGDTAGSVTYSKSLECLPERDVDGNNNGIPDLADVTQIRLKYNKANGTTGYSEAYDIACRNKINVVSISRVGLDFNRGS